MGKHGSAQWVASTPRQDVPWVHEQLALTLKALQGAGFTSLIYDYAPVPLDHEGRLITPNLLETCNTPDDLRTLWDGGYYQVDPVQTAALAVTAPFVWSYVGPQSDIMRRVINERHAPVIRYLNDVGLTCGITVPIHLAGGDLATFTAIRVGAERDFSRDIAHHRSAVGLIGQMFHDMVFPDFDEDTRTCQTIRLTPRERECLAWCAEGLTAKEIAYRLNRSIPTVILHLNAATRKLGARNRCQAITRASHYRLLRRPTSGGPEQPDPTAPISFDS